MTEVHHMKKIHRVAAAVIVATALAACSADPIGPSGRPSLLIVGATEAPPVHAADATTSTCVPSTGSGDTLVSGSSTYTVAYGCSCTTPPQVSGSSTYTVAYDGCAAPPADPVPPPPEDPVPPPPAPSVQLKLSFS